MTSKILLKFTDTLEIESAVFSHPMLDRPRVAYRARQSWEGVVGATSVIQWSSAVKAMCLLLVKYRMDPIKFAGLCGSRGSAAASFDYALGKEPNWLKDLFGTDAYGKSIALRLFIRFNPEGKKPGNFLVSVNSKALPSQNLGIVIGENIVQENEKLDMLASIIETTTWPGVDPLSSMHPVLESFKAFESLGN